MVGDCDVQELSETEGVSFQKKYPFSSEHPGFFVEGIGSSLDKSEACGIQRVHRFCHISKQLREETCRHVGVGVVVPHMIRNLINSTISTFHWVNTQ